MRIPRQFLCLFFVFSLPASADDEAVPERAQDLNYGTVLYEYYQGHAFEALTALKVATHKGGIKGHGDHPALVEGGLMLSYGMTRDAKAIFESLLEESNSQQVPTAISVSPSSRNQAWFYLGKVLYLEQDYLAALESLAKVDSVLLRTDAPALFQEWLYLKGQISQHRGQNLSALAEQIELLPEGNLWRAYLRYNQAVSVADKHPEMTISQLQSLSQSLGNTLDKENSDFEERRALREQCLLTLGQLQLQLTQYTHAIEAFKQIRLDSVFSDQALFAYSIAASNMKQYGLALQALNTLKARSLFTPWLQQVPYALAYVYEQLKQPELALDAYRAAASHYHQVSEQLEFDHQTLTEQKIMRALKLDDAAPLQLGIEPIANDAYGHLKVEPLDFNIAGLLSSEVFQLGLRDLHELYKLKFSLARWERQLDSFSLMLETRGQLRDQRIEETVAAIESQQAEHWVDQQKDYLAQITQAKRDEDMAFFASKQQLEFKTQIQSVFDALERFPEGEEKNAFIQKIRRIKAYYDWWVADQYGVNLWQAEKQLIGLTHATEEFNARHVKLKQQIQSNQQNALLASRVNEGRERLKRLSLELDRRLDDARLQLVQQVRNDLAMQRGEIQQYLLASRKAQARLSDLLYVQHNQVKRVTPDSPTEAKSRETEVEQ